jgi:hypothetical protein
MACARSLVFKRLDDLACRQRPDLARRAACLWLPAMAIDHAPRAGLPYLPTVTADAPTRHSATLRVPAKHPALTGHFPGNPIVPGVVILDAVICAAEAWLGASFRARPPHAKFIAPLKPDEAARIELVPGPPLEFSSIAARPRSRRDVERRQGTALVRTPGSSVPRAEAVAIRLLVGRGTWP